MKKGLSHLETDYPCANYGPGQCHTCACLLSRAELADRVFFSMLFTPIKRQKTRPIEDAFLMCILLRREKFQEHTGRRWRA